MSPLLLIAILWVYNSGKSSDVIAAAPFWLCGVLWVIILFTIAFLFWFVYDDIRDRAIADWMPFNSDGAGGYLAAWMIKNDMYIKRYVDSF